MTIEEFQREASRAFESDAEVNVVATISASRAHPKPMFKVLFYNGDETASGEGFDAKEAIRRCKEKRAQSLQEEKAKAKRLLGIP